MSSILLFSKKEKNEKRENAELSINHDFDTLFTHTHRHERKHTHTHADTKLLIIYYGPYECWLLRCVWETLHRLSLFFRRCDVEDEDEILNPGIIRFQFPRLVILLQPKTITQNVCAHTATHSLANTRTHTHARFYVCVVAYQWTTG